MKKEKRKIPLWIITGIIGGLFGVLFGFYAWLVGMGGSQIPLEFIFKIFPFSHIIIFILIGILIGYIIDKRKRIKWFCIFLFCFVLLARSSYGLTDLEDTNVIFDVNHLSGIRDNVILPVYIKIINNYSQPIFIKNISIITNSIILQEKKLDLELEIFKIPNETCNSSIDIEGLFTTTLYLDIPRLIPEEEFLVGNKINFETILAYELNNTLYIKNFSSSITILPQLPFMANSPGWYYGDLHLHTKYTDCDWTHSGVGTVSDRKQEAINLGMKWISITDHSYCFGDDSPYVSPEDDWNNLKSDVHSTTSSSFIALHSEELSVSEDCPVGNDDESLCQATPYACTGDAGHMNTHSIESFIENTPRNCHLGVSARCPTYPGSQEGINLTNSLGGFAIINHPSPYSDHYWDFESLSCVSNFTGLEVWNGEFDDLDQDALDYWVGQLLSNKRIYAYSGTDSEPCSLGNDCREASCLTGCRSDYKLLVYNGCYLDSLTETNLKNAFKNGRCFIMNNGFLSFNIRGTYDTDWKKLGSEIDVCSGEQMTIKTDYYTFDRCNLQLKKGYIGSNSEIIKNESSVTGSGSYQFNDSFTYNSGYYRAECVNGTTNKRIYTNPIWFNIHTENSDGDTVCDFYDCDPNDSSVYLGAPEMCDNKDNDCDGQVDESFPNKGQTCGVGVCTGIYVCKADKSSLVCNGPSPKQETCGNGIDDDCDGTVDEGCLTIIIHSPVNKTYDNRKVLLNISLNEPVKSVYVSLNGERFSKICSDCNSTTYTDYTREGFNELIVKTINYDDSSINASVNFSVDTYKPSISSIAPENKEYSKGITRFTIKYTEGNLENISVFYGASAFNEFIMPHCPSGRYQECSADIDLSSYDGKQVQYYFVVRDQVHNITSTINTIFIDNKVPVVTISSPEVELPVNQGFYKTRRIPLTVNVSENVETLEMSMDWGRFSRLCGNCNYYNRVRSFDEGKHTLTIKAVDKAGNEGYAEVQFIVDSVEPRIRSIYPENGDFVKGLANFTVEYDEEALKNISLFYGVGGSFNEYSTANYDICPPGRRQKCTLIIDLSDYDNQTVEYYFIVRSIFYNGTSKTNSVIVDNTNPVITVRSPENKTYDTNYVRLAIGVSEKVELLRSINGGRFTRLCNNCNLYDRTSYFRDGTYNITFLAIDKADNEGFSFRVFDVK